MRQKRDPEMFEEEGKYIVYVITMVVKLVYFMVC